MTTNAEIEALAGKLREFAKTLTEPEQELLEQLLERATALSDEELAGVAGGIGNLGPALEPRAPASSILKEGGPAAKLRRA